MTQYVRERERTRKRERKRERERVYVCVHVRVYVYTYFDDALCSWQKKYTQVLPETDASCAVSDSLQFGAQDWRQKSQGALQCVTTCCSALQCVSISCSKSMPKILRCDAVWFSVWQFAVVCVAVCCSVLQCVVVYYSSVLKIDVENLHGVCHDSFICRTWLVQMFEMTQSCV